MEEIIERENEFNKKLLFFEDKKLYLEQENKRIEKSQEELFINRKKIIH